MVAYKTISETFDCSNCTGIELKTTGDGQRYKLILRDETKWNGVAWTSCFDTKAGNLTEHKIPFSEQIPTRFTNTLKKMKRMFNKSQLTTVEFRLSKYEFDCTPNPKFTPGEFKLEIDSISTY